MAGNKNGTFLKFLNYSHTNISYVLFLSPYTKFNIMKKGKKSAKTLERKVYSFYSDLKVSILEVFINQNILNAYSMQGIVLGARYIRMNKLKCQPSQSALYRILRRQM